MLKLYGGARSRASIVRWYLEELAIPYEFILLDMQAGEHRQPEFLALNPFGKVPTIVDGDVVLYESGAILLYLYEKYVQTDLTIAQRAILNQWVLFGNSTLATGIFVETSREQETPKLLTPLNEILSKHSFLLGDEFTVVDVAVGSILAYIPMMLKMDLSDYPEVVNYIQRLTSRPAYQTAMSGR
jgi:glutathione S-transferase